MHRLNRQEGASSLKVLFWIALAFSVVHVSITIVPMYLDFWSMEDEIKIKAASAQLFKDEEILYALMNKAKERDLPLTKESFVIVRNTDDRTIRISTSWTMEKKFFWGICGEPCNRTYVFQPSAQGTF